MEEASIVTNAHLIDGFFCGERVDQEHLKVCVFIFDVDTVILCNLHTMIMNVPEV